MNQLSVRCFGDIYAWYHGDQLQEHEGNFPDVQKSNVSKEIADFEKSILKDLR